VDGRPAVFVTDSLPREAKDELTRFEVFESTIEDPVLHRVQVLICWPPRANSELLKKMTGLKVVQSLSAGVEKLDFRALPPGVSVFSNAGAYTDAVAEHAWGILLGLAKGVHLRNQRTTPRKLRGKTLLVLGAGSIGTEVARLAKSLGMRTIGISRSFSGPEWFDERGGLSDLSSKIGEADAAVMALPLTNLTRGVMSYEVLAKAKDALLLVNVGRGESVPEPDLLRWLKERKESRFATDVFWIKGGKESFDTAAWDLPNFAGTLHISGVPLGEDLSRAKVAAAKNVRRFFDTGDALNRVDASEYV
jgi:phosphoglycerate dehydrogenase-like enzyme